MSYSVYQGAGTHKRRLASINVGNLAYSVSK